MKYYLYIDECGDNNLKNFDEQFPIFTLCGIVVSEDKREWLEKEVQALKDEFWGNQYTILHSRDIRKCQRGFEILFDLDVKKCFYERVNAILGTWASAERLRRYAKSFKLLPKKANVVGLQVADLVAYPITRHILDPNEPNMAYDVIKNNIYTENMKQVGIKIIPNT